MTTTIPGQVRRDRSASLDSVTAAIADLRSGRPVIVVDDEDRENEGDLIMAAEHATAHAIAFYLRHTSGLICAPMTPEVVDRLRLPQMVQDNEDPAGTAYTVSVDAAECIESGISAADRAHTLRVLADPNTTSGMVLAIPNATTAFDFATLALADHLAADAHIAAKTVSALVGV